MLIVHAREEKKMTLNDMPAPSSSMDRVSSFFKAWAKVPPPSAVDPIDPEKSTT